MPKGKLTVERTLSCGICGRMDNGATLAKSNHRTTEDFLIGMMRKGWEKTREYGWLCWLCVGK